MNRESSGKTDAEGTGAGEARPARSESERARAERQAAALRANLRRRNAQRRGRETDETDSGPGGDPD